MTLRSNLESDPFALPDPDRAPAPVRPLWGSVPPPVRALPQPPEPLEWRPVPKFRERVLAAISVPIVVGVVLFAAAVLAAVLLGVPRLTGSEGLQPGADQAAVDPASVDPASVDPASVDPASVHPSASAVDPDTVLVHVVGKVRAPGVVSLARGARVADAIEAAGGATSKAALAAINLARVVVDGEQIVVVKPAPGSGGAARGAVAGSAGGAGGAGASAAAESLVSLNTADAAALEQLPRIGPALAQRIVAWRDANGGFTSVDQLLRVSGIGAKTLDGFRDRVTL